MYTLDEIKRLQVNPEYYIDEGDRFCLIGIMGHELTETLAANHSKFCVLQILKAYKEKKIEANTANFLIDKVDAIYDSMDLLGAENVISKLSLEIIEEELHIPHFNYICVECETLYNDFQ